MINVNEIKKNYAAFDDAKILRLAKNESKSLRDDVIPILLEEMKKRGLHPSLIEWIEAERRILSEAELFALKQKVKNNTCSICNQKKTLEGFKYTTIISFLIGYTRNKCIRIVCSSCGTKLKKESNLKTVTLGWWSPSGFVATLSICTQKIINSINEQDESEELIESFIKNHLGTITLENDSKEYIRELLERYNRVEHLG